MPTAKLLDDIAQSRRDTVKTSHPRRNIHTLPLATILAGVTLFHTAAQATSEERLSASLDKVLSAHVANGRVDYPAIVDSPDFSEYLTELEQADLDELEDTSRQLVFWINAYNALAIKGILDGNSPSSFFGRVAFFKTTDHEVGGDEINLYDLERDVLIPLGEPRIHFAIVCASHSCPKLRSEAYTIEGLETQLEEQTRQFINDTSRNRFDRDEKVAYVSKIFDWFDDDFEEHAGSIQKYVARYVDDPRLAEELAAEEYEVEFLDYDWSLNGTPPKD